MSFHSRMVEVAAADSWCRLAILTPIECRLLCVLLNHAGRVLDRRLIIEAVWRERAPGIAPSVVDKHVGTLRRKLEGWSTRVRTVYGGGYGYVETIDHEALAAQAALSKPLKATSQDG
ncbi:MAG: winged helix-turn-helix domain-containing protein [Elusimicrobia bacterium]|nr:winged helix-turn-helix domain-containing protein [Elusimicrobiota bacterium]